MRNHLTLVRSACAVLLVAAAFALVPVQQAKADTLYIKGVNCSAGCSSSDAADIIVVSLNKGLYSPGEQVIATVEAKDDVCSNLGFTPHLTVTATPNYSTSSSTLLQNKSLGNSAKPWEWTSFAKASASFIGPTMTGSYAINFHIVGTHVAASGLFGLPSVESQTIDYALPFMVIAPPTSTVILTGPSASIAGSGCRLDATTGTCDVTVFWTATSTANDLVDITFIPPGGSETSWAIGTTSANTVSALATTAGTFTYKLYDHGTTDLLATTNVLVSTAPTTTSACPDGSAPDANGNCSGGGTSCVDGVCTVTTCTTSGCTATAACDTAAGYTLVNGTCTKISTCTGGQVLNATKSGCVCPNGQFLSHVGICVDSSCSANAGEPCSSNNSCGNDLHTGTYNCDGSTCSASAPNEALCIPKAQLGFSASPSSVNANQTTTLRWDATNVEDCAVSGWSVSVPATAANSSKEVTGSVVTSGIQGSTVYTLTCHDLTGASVSQSLTVKLIPSYQER